MKVFIVNKPTTIDNSNIHSNYKTLAKMIESTNLNIKSAVRIDKTDNYKKTFLQSTNNSKYL